MAVAQLAYEDAVNHYERALEYSEHCQSDGATTYGLLLALGEARTRLGDLKGSRLVLRQALTIAEVIGDRDMFARAALAFGGLPFSLRAERRVDDEIVAVLEQALATIGDGDSAVRALLMARLSRALYHSHLDQKRVWLSEQALAMGYRIGDVNAQIAALQSSYWAYWEPSATARRTRATREIVRLAKLVGDREMELHGHQLECFEVAQCGNGVASKDELLTCAALEERLGQPVHSWLTLSMRASQALTVGRFDEGEELAHTATSAGESIGIPVARRILVALLFWESCERDRLSDILPLIDASIEACRCGRCAAASAWVSWLRGQGQAAALAFDLLAKDGFVGLERNSERLSAMTTLAQLCVVLEDARRAEQLYDLLLPFAGRFAPEGVCIAYGGSASFHLGMLASSLARWSDAQQHFEAALTAEEARGASPRRARTAYEFARMLAGSHLDASKREAGELIGYAVAIADTFGMVRLAREARAVGQELATTVEHGVPPAGVGGLFVREGEYWTIRFEGTTVRVKDARGVRYLARLLASPGEEFHVSDLAGAPRALFEGADPVLDAAATNAYRLRLVDLQDELSEAEDHDDEGRRMTVQNEIELLTAQLTAAYGLNNRQRLLGDSGEKIRKAVTVRIRSAIRKLQAQHPRLGRHLANSIRTGKFCSYNPELPVDWEVRT